MKSLSLMLSLLSLLVGCGKQLREAPPVFASFQQPAPIASESAGPASRPDASVRRPAATGEANASAERETAPLRAPGQPVPASTPAQAGGKALQIRLYRSYGNEGLVHVRGRVMEPEEQRPVNSEDSSLTNFWRNLTSLSVDEKAGIKVDLSVEGHTVRLVSDKEGMLLVSTTLFGRLEPGLETLSAELVPGQGYWAPLAETRVVIQPEAESSLGFVSDIDDTIKVSDVTNKLSAVRRLLFTNEKTAEAIPGTAALYRILEAHDGQADGDLHYLSGSPIHLADAIYGFLDRNAYPRGAVDLKKWGFAKGDDNPLQQQDYKQEKLRLLLKTYPNKLFICFGDSGEKDPEIYRQIAKEYPGRIKAIFINNVTNAKAGDPRFAGEHLTNNAGEAANLLQRAGLLSEADVATVKQAL